MGGALGQLRQNPSAREAGNLQASRSHLVMGCVLCLRLDRGIVGLSGGGNREAQRFLFVAQEVDKCSPRHAGNLTA